MLEKSSIRLPLLVVGLLFVVTTFIALTEAVDSSKFKTCNDLSFCKRNRRVDITDAAQMSLYKHQIVADSVQLKDGRLVGEIVEQDGEVDHVLSFEIRAIANGILRFRVLEKSPLANKKRYQVQDVLLDDINPFQLDVYVAGELAMSANSRGLFHFEHMRNKPLPPQPIPNPNPPEGEEPPAPQQPVVPEGMWEERFQSHHDSKPHGPMSIGMDIKFVGSQHVYGIPEHTTSLALRNTRGEGINENPYRLYNLDVFEYELDKTMALYGAVPLMISHDTKKTVALFWLNAAETFIDVSDSKDDKNVPSKDTHWISETGAMDVFFLTGPTPMEIFKQYASLTGTTALPQLFSLGYHQCRWNYKDENDVKQVDEGFDSNNIPYDVIWLDIEHTDGKRYFTWDKANFPTPDAMQKSIAIKHRKMVTIIDPHIKRDNNYYIHSQATSNNHYVKKADGVSDYEGWCWPGSSSYLDFTNPVVRNWWAEQFAYDKYIGSTPTLYVWNDMNEPSVFDGPEVSMHKDALHHGSVEHRDLHNMYGYYYHMATADGLVKRNSDQNDRPFVLSRAFFAGSQRIGAIWTGDNAAQWSHLKVANPMLLSLGLAGITFSGADVGGFFGNPDGELMARWYQAGAFQPFFRGHAHLDAKRREPWLFGEPYLSVMRSAIQQRYSFLPLWYTIFYQNTLNGAPTMRPLWVEFPSDANLFAVESEYMIGSALLVHPVVEQGQKQVKVILPGDAAKQQWFDIDTNKMYKPGQYDVDTPLQKIPVYQRGGSIVAKKERLRRSSYQMRDDPYTLKVALNTDQVATGELFMDDEHSFNYKKGQYQYRQFRYENGQLTSKSLDTKGTFKPVNTVERIVVLGINNKPSAISYADKPLQFEYDKSLSSVVIRKPDLPISSDWTINFKF
ncbi:alpha-glucosidase II [Heterostelium album PN500]|uniref:Glucosidase II subunit alpha n=1 Tax=Heterostelium pallidum (strain ATCC 26659 / Pp 5 / PN500) TaxID=670386 RepID=D3BP16_HETP5|nr:alpha-glucosidase II [Heterostelium album PN500]EFA77026.1 alpha-glucosidase II [Heterostelium album PN500]|eukprot:XP_020429156.1 alpha-glucosidase II [Heterostelium album PN500]